MVASLLPLSHHILRPVERAAQGILHERRTGNTLSGSTALFGSNGTDTLVKQRSNSSTCPAVLGVSRAAPNTNAGLGPLQLQGEEWSTENDFQELCSSVLEVLLNDVLRCAAVPPFSKLMHCTFANPMQ